MNEYQVLDEIGKVCVGCVCVTVLCYVVVYGMVWCHVLLCGIWAWGGVVLYSMPYGFVRYGDVWCSRYSKGMVSFVFYIFTMFSPIFQGSYGVVRMCHSESDHRNYVSTLLSINPNYVL